MSACTEHVQYQLSNEHSHIGLLIDAIQCADAGLQAAMGSIKTDNGLYGLQNNFKRAVAHTDDQSRATKQEQANLCAVTVLCAST